MIPNIQNSFTISENGLSLNEEALILHGSYDPGLSPGQDAPIGSIFLRTDVPNLYQKNGVSVTNWILINSNNPINTNIPIVQLLRSSNQNLTTTFADINFDITDLQTDISILEHDTVNINRILIKETGLYQLQYALSINANNIENIFNTRIIINNTTVIPASNREISEAKNIDSVSNVFYTLLNAGDYVSLQIKSDGTGDVLWNTANFSISKFSASRGVQGLTGSGSSITLKDNGVLLPNTPHGIINFTSGLLVNDTGSEATITVPQPIFGSEFQTVESLGVTSTTSTTLQQKLLLTTTTIPGGKYRIGIAYGWNYNSTGRDFLCEIHEDGIIIGQPHRQEPKDSAGNFLGTRSNQRHYINRTFYRTLTPGTHTFEVLFRSTSNGVTTSIWDCSIEFWRVT